MICGINSDGDRFPDVNLSCNVSSCQMVILNSNLLYHYIKSK